MMSMRIGYDEALAAQPGVLPRSAAHVRDQLSRLHAPSFSSGTVAVVGIGASLNAAQLLVDLLRAGGRPAVALSAAVASESGLVAGLADAFVFLSESGDSTETIQAAAGVVGARSRPTLSITNDPGSTLARMTDFHVDLGCGPDSGVYTVGFTATVQAVALLTSWLGVDGADTRVPATIPEPDAAMLAGVAERLSACRGIDVVGAGPHLCSALQTALMLREGCRMPSAAFDTREYLHGPLEWLGPDSGCIFFGSGRETELAAFARSTGAVVVRFGDVPAGAGRDAGSSGAASVIAAPSDGSVAAVLYETIAVQQLVRLIAGLHGVPVGTMRYAQTDTKRSGTY